MGWLIVEDLVTVLILVLLPALATSLGGTAGARDPLRSWTMTATQIYVAIGIIARKIHRVCSADAGRRFPIAAVVAETSGATGSRELFTLAVIAVAIGIGFGAAELFGLSFALGAFFAGVVVGESDHSHQATEEMRPLQDAFTALFFVAMGMLFDPEILVKQPLQVLTVLTIIVIGKSAIAFVGRRSAATAGRLSAHRRGESGPDRRVLLYPCRTRNWSSFAAGRGSKPDCGRRAPIHRSELLPAARRHCSRQTN